MFTQSLTRSWGGEDTHRVEIVLATARALLTGTFFLAIVADRTQPAWLSPLVHPLLITYLAYSLGLLVMMRARAGHTLGFLYAVHFADILWPIFLTLFSQTASSPFFLFFVFVIFAAAYRWGMRDTLITTLMLVSVLMTFTSLSALTTVSSYVHTPMSPQLAWTLAGYLLVTGLLAGYLGEQQKQSRYEKDTIARLMACIRLEDGVAGTLTALFDVVMRAINSKEAILIVRNIAGHRAFLWVAKREARDSVPVLTTRELLGSEKQAFLFDLPEGAAKVRRRRKRIDLYVLSGKNQKIRKKVADWPTAFLTKFQFSRALMVSFRIGDEASGTIFLLNNGVGRIGSRGIRFLSRTAREVSPAVHNIYLLRRLRRQAAAIERARIARDLHDGVVQSLFGIEMRLHLLRKSRNTDEHTKQELGEIKKLVRDQLLNLRELVQEVRALEVTPARLLDFISETVEKFGRETGIAAHFEPDTDSIDLPPRYSREIARIVHESLVNVRKHSGAHAVMVKLKTANDEVALTIEDDGSGFDFTGELTLAELDRTHKGPVVIKERVRSLGGLLSIESSPFRGSRLVITLPKEAYGAKAASTA